MVNMDLVYIEKNLAMITEMAKDTLKVIKRVRQNGLYTSSANRFYVFVATLKQDNAKDIMYVGIRHLPARYTNADKDASWFGAEMNKKLSNKSVKAKIQITKTIIREYLSKDEAITVRNKTVRNLKASHPNAIIEFCSYSTRAKSMK